jgi:hypothetical protein
MLFDAASRAAAKGSDAAAVKQLWGLLDAMVGGRQTWHRDIDCLEGFGVNTINAIDAASVETAKASWCVPG